MQKRVITYIDGFNLYFGLKSKGWKRFYWLDARRLSLNLLRPGQVLISAKYFTAVVKESPDKQQRQKTYLEALSTLPDFHIFYGKYQMNPRQCPRCGYQELVPNEKMTDVNIATELLADAFQNAFDTAVIVSADSDLARSILKVQQLFPDKTIVIAFPPGRYSSELHALVKCSFIIGRRTIGSSLFPDIVNKSNGYKLIKPQQWV